MSAVLSNPGPMVRSEQMLEAEFTRAVYGLHAEDRIGFARHPMTVAEVMFDALDTGKEVPLEAMRIVQRLAQSKNADAMELVQLLAHTFAHANAEDAS